MMSKKNSVLKQIPNSITLLNLIAGCFAIILAFYGEVIYASALIFLAAIFDFLDGFMARLLKAFSSIGKELDSFADLVSFGIAPAALLFQLLLRSFSIHNSDFNISESSLNDILLLSTPVLIVMFSAIRLAKFNISTTQTNSFIGLPTPANAILIASLLLIVFLPQDSIILKNSFIENNEIVYKVLMNKYFIIGLIMALSILLVAPIRLIALKFKSFSFKENWYRYSIIFIAIILLVLLQVIAIPIIFVIYIILSLIAFKSLSN